jgi:hypothetical protein
MFCLTRDAQNSPRCHLCWELVTNIQKEDVKNVLEGKDVTDKLAKIEVDNMKTDIHYGGTKDLLRVQPVCTH